MPFFTVADHYRWQTTTRFPNTNKSIDECCFPGTGIINDIMFVVSLALCLNTYVFIYFLYLTFGYKSDKNKSLIDMSIGCLFLSSLVM